MIMLYSCAPAIYAQEIDPNATISAETNVTTQSSNEIINESIEIDVSEEEITTPEETQPQTTSPTEAPLPSEEKTETVSEAITQTETAAIADTGNNTIIATGSAEMETDTAIAIANSTNVINVDSQNSTTEIEIANNPQTDSSTNTSLAEPEITTKQDSKTETDTLNLSQHTATTSAIANTGGNVIVTAQDATLITRNATAVANAINIINVTINNSTVYIVIYNISPDSDALIILPRPELFALPPDSNQPTPAQYEINYAQVNTLVTAYANSGNNTATASDNSIQTGDAIAISQQINIINSIINQASYYLLTINHPLTDVLLPTYASADLQTTPSPSQTTLTSQADSIPSSTIEPTTNKVQNQTIINQSITAIATSGQNAGQANNSSEIITGISVAIANAIQLINTTIINSKIFIGIINVLGNWNGQLLFNYPDIAIAANTTSLQIDAGQSIDYQVTISNQGHDTAHQPSITINHDDHITNHLLPDLQANESQIITLSLSPPDKNRSQTKISASVTISDPEINTTNNQTTIIIPIHQPTIHSTSSSNENIASGIPKITITATNNVVNPVNPGDTITFEFNIKNDSDYPAYQNFLNHAIYNQDGQMVGSIAIPLGTLQGHDGGTLRFGITTPASGQWGTGSFSTLSQIQATSSSEQNIISNTVATTFAIKNIFQLIKTVRAADHQPQSPAILGTNDNVTPPQPKSPLFPYLLLLLLSLQYLIKNRHIAGFASLILYVFALSTYLISVYQLTTQNNLLQPIAFIDNNYHLLEGKIRQFL